MRNSYIIAVATAIIIHIFTFIIFLTAVSLVHIDIVVMRIWLECLRPDAFIDVTRLLPGSDRFISTTDHEGCAKPTLPFLFHIHIK